MPAKHLLDHTRETGSSARVWVAATVAVITDPPRGLLCTTDGTVAMDDENGTGLTVAMTGGNFYALSPSEITSLGTAVVWLLY